MRGWRAWSEWLFTILTFLLRSFIGPLLKKSWIKKWLEPKNSKYKKISFFMPVNHTKKFLKSVHTVGFFLWLFSETLNFYFFSVPVLIKILINQKLLLRLQLNYPRMSILIREKWNWSKLNIDVPTTHCFSSLNSSHYVLHKISTKHTSHIELGLRFFGGLSNVSFLFHCSYAIVQKFLEEKVQKGKPLKRPILPWFINVVLLLFETSKYWTVEHTYFLGYINVTSKLTLTYIFSSVWVQISSCWIQWKRKKAPKRILNLNWSPPIRESGI